MSEKKNSNLVYKVINQYFAHRYTTNVEEEIQQWLVDEQHAAEKEEALTEIWDKLEHSTAENTVSSLDLLKAKLNFAESISNNEAREGQKESNNIIKVPFYKYAFRIAAVIIPVLMIVGAYLILNRNTVEPELIVEDTPQSIEFSVPKGSPRQSILLPDSSVVLVSGGSKIVYSNKMGEKERLVDLYGEAYFIVKKLEVTNPFIVNTRHLDITVLGTEFNMKSYTEDKDIVVILDKGSIIVETETNKTFRLEPNQKLVYNKESGEVSVTEVKQEKEKKQIKKMSLILEDATLEDIVVAFEREYAISIIVDDSTLYTTDRYSLQFVHNETIEQAMDILKDVVGDIQYKINKGKVTISKRG